MKVETQQEADQLNESGTYGPYMAANGHLMVAELRFPLIEDFKQPPTEVGRIEREYLVGDEVRYITWNAWCAPECKHDSPPEDW